MYIEKKKTGLDVLDLITLVQRQGGVNTGFPYKSFVCRCSNCQYSTKGKCALQECCCMDERIRAHTCTFGEMMRYCFSGIGDNVFHFRLRIAIEREAELKSCFLDTGHRKRFYEGLAYTRKGKLPRYPRKDHHRERQGGRLRGHRCEDHHRRCCRCCHSRRSLRAL